jgi:RNA polymerase sigma-70 factor (ECF subfamily)
VTSDEELVRRFCAGDRNAFSELVLRHQDRVYTICLRWMGDRETAEDLAQEVFMAVYRSLPNFRGESKLSTWITRIAVNHCKNHKVHRFRRAYDRHDPIDSPESEDAPPRQIASATPGTDSQLHHSEAGQALERALADLDDSHRSIILLRDIEDLPYEEIADILDLPKGTVKSRLHRARAALAQALSRFLGKDDVLD